MKANKEFLIKLYGYGLSDENIERALQTFENVSLEILTPRENRVLELRYIENKTLEKSGKELGITRERVRQIECKAIHKLQTPRATTKIFTNDLDREIERLRLEKEEIAQKLRKQIVVLNQFLNGINIETEDLKEINPILEAPIGYLDLSIRSRNCLLRANIKTVGELTNVPIQDLMRIRNLGLKSLKEIIDKVHEKGLSFWDESSIKELQKRFDPFNEYYDDED